MSKQRILIIDDNPMIAKMVGAWLEKTGLYATRQENRPLLALSTARRFKPDLVLIDVDMPEMDGNRVAYALRRDPNLEETPILFLTALPAKQEAEKGGRRGAKSIPKPISPAELIDHVAEALAHPHEAVCG